MQPVSYTHLRAHETVLDLVCRLLLEQKKQNTTQHITLKNLPPHTLTVPPVLSMHTQQHIIPAESVTA